MQNVGPLLPLVSSALFVLPVDQSESGAAFAGVLGQGDPAPLPIVTSDASEIGHSDAPASVDLPADLEGVPADLSVDPSAIVPDFGTTPFWPQVITTPAPQRDVPDGSSDTMGRGADASYQALPDVAGRSAAAHLAALLPPAAAGVLPLSADATKASTVVDDLRTDAIVAPTHAAPDGRGRRVTDQVFLEKQGWPTPAASENREPAVATAPPAAGPSENAVVTLPPSAPYLQMMTPLHATAAAPLGGLRVAEAALRPVATPARPEMNVVVQLPDGATAHIVAQAVTSATFPASPVTVEDPLVRDSGQTAEPDGLSRGSQAPPASADRSAPVDKVQSAQVQGQSMAVEIVDLAGDWNLADGVAATATAQTTPPIPASVTGPPHAAIPLAALPQAVVQALRNDPAWQVELRLDPPELGSVRFQLDQRNADLVVTIIAERPETLDLMRRHSEQLLADLRQAGFAGASLNFGTSQGQGGFGQQGFGQGGFGPGTAHDPGPDESAAQVPPQAFSTPPPRSAAKGGLNLRL